MKQLHVLCLVALGLERAASEAAGARYAPAVLSRQFLYPTWLSPHGNDARFPRARGAQTARSMPPAINMDIKVSFEVYDMTPGQKGREFLRNLYVHGGKTDSRGFSMADCMLRQDEGAVIGPAFAAGAAAAPNAIAMPANAAQLLDAQQKRRARIKYTFEFITRHICDEHTLTLAGDPTDRLFQDAPEFHDYIVSQVIVMPTTSEIQDMNIDWWGSRRWWAERARAACFEDP